MENLNSHFLAFLKLLEAHEVSYLVVGGYAVGYYGFPRYTGDIDVFIAVGEENAAKMMQVFSEFGFGNIGISKTDFLEEAFVVEIGREPTKIQVLTGIDGVSFEACYANKVSIRYDDTNINLINLDDLLKNKEASARAKDKIDVIELKRLNQKK